MVRNSKAKVSRTKKKYGVNLNEVVELPPIEAFGTRKEFNEWKEKTGSFTNRNNLNYQFVKNDYGVVASKKEINEVERDAKNAQRIADKKRKEAEKKPFISGGKVQGTVEQRLLMMGKPNVGGIVRPPDFDFKKIRSKHQFEKKKENMKNRADESYLDERTERMKDRFIQSLEFSFNSDADDLIDIIRNMPSDDFYEIYLIHDEFDFKYYPSPQTDYDGETVDEGRMYDQLHEMKSTLQKYLDGKINMDLKGF